MASHASVADADKPFGERTFVAGKVVFEPRPRGYLRVQTPDVDVILLREHAAKCGLARESDGMTRMDYRIGGRGELQTFKLPMSDTPLATLRAFLDACDASRSAE